MYWNRAVRICKANEIHNYRLKISMKERRLKLVEVLQQLCCVTV